MKLSRTSAIALGLIWSALAVWVSSRLSGEMAGASFAVSGSALGWLLLVSLLPKAATSGLVVVKVDPSAQEGLSAVEGVLRECAVSFRLQHEAIRSEVGRVQSMLSDAIVTLTASFNGILAATQAQETIAVSLVKDDEDSASGASFDEFIQNTSEVMQKVVDKIIMNSKLGMELVELTDRISRRAADVESILGEIAGIAKQTNLLALNAAIEAARAGEQGRGFAVVADEVRNLAARTANSTREISEMVKSIQQGTAGAVEGMERGVERVNAGVARAEKAGEAMARIRQAAEQVQATVAEISHALREQSSASTEIAQQVEMIARMAEENGLAVASNHQTAASLGTLADTLLGNVGRFRT